MWACRNVDGWGQTHTSMAVGNETGQGNSRVPCKPRIWGFFGLPLSSDAGNRRMVDPRQEFSAMSSAHRLRPQPPKSPSRSLFVRQTRPAAGQGSSQRQLANSVFGVSLHHESSTPIFGALLCPLPASNMLSVLVPIMHSTCHSARLLILRLPPSAFQKPLTSSRRVKTRAMAIVNVPD